MRDLIWDKERWEREYASVYAEYERWNERRMELERERALNAVYPFVVIQVSTASACVTGALTRGSDV
jgi:hypothetical protein